ncbi:hypothetical protein PsorP6_010427 [Peronosclerospora sorghi]|uniref:Uncharacterized protein n=1 Tax=Peronosclerospora sorghi TaxID=230839 RepID=A0ACC0VXP1_9STRA|nr:hypothetical protein PsorP6_010427 [Peronosclerospora sorghi]
MQVNGLVEGSETRFLEGLAQGRVGVARASEVFTSRAILNANHPLGNHLPSVASDNVDAKQLVRLLISQDLDETVRFGHRARPAIGHHGELADIVPDAFSLEFLLRLAHGSKLRERVDHTGNRIVVDMPVLPSNVFHACNPLFFRLVRQHGAFDHVANGKDTRHLRTEGLIDFNPTELVRLNAHLLQAQACSERATACSHEHRVARNRRRRTPLRRFSRELDKVTRDFGRRDFGAKLKLEPLFL